MPPVNDLLPTGATDDEIRQRSKELDQWGSELYGQAPKNAEGFVANLVIRAIETRDAQLVHDMFRGENFGYSVNEIRSFAEVKKAVEALKEGGHEGDEVEKILQECEGRGSESSEPSTGRK